MVLAIDVFVALWAPADLIIEDAIGPTTLGSGGVDQRQLPAALAHRACHPPRHQGEGDSSREDFTEKYREKREYISDDEESRYEIVLRYNRLA